MSGALVALSVGYLLRKRTKHKKMHHDSHASTVPNHDYTMPHPRKQMKGVANSMSVDLDADQRMDKFAKTELKRGHPKHGG